MSNDIYKVLGSVAKSLSGVPAGQEIFDRAARGEITDEAAAYELMAIAKEAGLLGELRKASSDIEALVGRTSTGVQQLNPLYEAGLAEMAFLDGDVPQFRSGPFPPEGRPAVPVVTSTTNPVAVGMMLEKASDIVLDKLQKATREYESKVRLLASNAETSIAEVRESLPAPPTGVVGYEAGRNPLALTVEEPSPLKVAEVPLREAQRYSYKAISTTQGRLSLAPPLQEKLVQALREEGIDAAPFEGGEEANPVVSEAWGIQAFGAEDVSPSFDYTEAALRYFVSKARAARPSGPVKVRVVPWGNPSERKFGWAFILNRGG